MMKKQRSVSGSEQSGAREWVNTHNICGWDWPLYRPCLSEWADGEMLNVRHILKINSAFR